MATWFEMSRNYVVTDMLAMKTDDSLNPYISWIKYPKIKIG